jgi:hypothetical protein
MRWFKKLCVFLFSVLLLISLLGGVLSFSIDNAFDHPIKIEHWLSDSDLYADFVKLIVTQAGTATASGLHIGEVSFSNTAVQQIAESVFSPSVLQQYTETFLNANYEWLEGKSAIPRFTINLSQAKQNFAQQVGQYVTTRLSSLPTCTATEAITEEETLVTASSNPLQLSCRPTNLNAISTGALVAQQIASSPILLKNTVITEKNFRPDNNSDSKPYYEQSFNAPKLYQVNEKAPYIFGGLAVISVIAALFMSTTKRRGMRHIGFAFIDAGILLIVASLVSNAAFSILKRVLMKRNSNEAVQRGITNFVVLIEKQISSINLDCGIAFIAIAICIFLGLMITRKHVHRLSYAVADPEDIELPPRPTATGQSDTIQPHNQPIVSSTNIGTNARQKSKRSHLIQ